MAWNNTLIVFTKPWKEDSMDALAGRVAALGLRGVELPVREGYPVNPGNYASALPRMRAALGEKNIRALSVAGAIDGGLIRGMGENGAGILRVMLNADPKKNYQEQEEAYYRKISDLLPVLADSKVVLGAQNHFGNFLGCGASGLMRFVGRFPAAQVGAVLDLAHCALAGEIPEFALDIAASHLVMVNIKNGCRRRTNPVTAPEAEWKTAWVTGRHGALSWPLVAEELKRRGYSGPICLTAEYSGPAGALEGEDAYALVKEDLAYWSSLG